MTWHQQLRADIVEEFAEAQRRPERSSCRTDAEADEQLIPAVRHRRVRALTALEVAFLVELRRDPRVARAAAALKLGSTVARKTAVRLSRQRLIRLEHLKNKRRTLVARFVAPGFYE